MSFHAVRRTIAEQMRGVDCVGKPKRVAHNTVRYVHADGSTRWRHHLTDVVIRHTDGTFTLNTGGHHSSTTKERINDYSPVRIYQKNYEWYMPRRAEDGSYDWKATPIPFVDGMRVNERGEPIE